MYPLIKMKQIRKERGMTQKRVADALGISQNTYSYWETGRNKVDNESLRKLSQLFEVSVDYLLGNKLTDKKSDGVLVPILGRVEAGIPVEAVEDVLDYEEIPAKLAETGEFFALQIKGMSMEPKFSEGDVVIVRAQADCDNGDIAVVMVNGEEATIKRIKKRSEGIMLIPSNPDFEPMFYTNEEIRSLPVSIIGKVVELRAKF